MRENREIITTISTRRLTRGYWFEFMTMFVEIVTKTTPEQIGFEQMWEKFLKLYEKSDDFMRPLRKSGLTHELVELDAVRTTFFRQIKQNIKTFTDHYDAEKAEAANKIMVVFPAYRSLTSEGITARSGDIYNVVDDLRTKFAAELETLELTQWVNELDKKNNEFEDLWGQRNAQMTAVKPKQRFEEIAPKMNYFYDMFMWLLEYKMNNEPSESVKKFVWQWNGVIHSYKTALAQKEGRKKD